MRVIKICDFFLNHYSEIKQDRYTTALIYEYRSNLILLNNCMTANRYRDPLMALKLTKDDDGNKEIYETLAAILDQYADDAQVMHPFLDVLRVLCQVDSNRMHLKEIESVCENVELTAKMNRKNVGKLSLPT